MEPVDRLITRSWPLFSEAIRQARTISYTELAGRVGPPLNRRHVHRQLLVPLAERCRRAGLPDLCALVVRKDSGRPGGGWFTNQTGLEPLAAWAQAVQQCWNYPWPRSVPPALLDNPSTNSNIPKNSREPATKPRRNTRARGGDAAAGPTRE